MTSRLAARLGSATAWLRNQASVVIQSPLFPIILIGLLIRAALAVYSSEGDLSVFAEMSSSMLQGGGPYTFINVYPPDWAYLLNLVGRVDVLFQPPSAILSSPVYPATLSHWFPLEPDAVVSPTYSVVEKSPLWVFDVGTGLLLYHLSKRWPARGLTPKTLFALWFLNPLVILESGMHGDYDVIPVFFLLASFVLIEGRSHGFAGLALGLAITLKVFPIFLAPLLVVAIWKQQLTTGWRRLRPMITFGLGVGLAGAVVFWPPGVLSDYLLYSGTGPSVGLNYAGFWVWSLGDLPRYLLIRALLYQDSIAVFWISTFVAVVISLAIGAACFRRRVATPYSPVFLAYCILAFSAVYLVTPTVQVQYLIWILPFLLLATLADSLYLWAVGAVSTLPSIFYLLGLGGPAYHFEALGLYTQTTTLSALTTSIRYFYPLQSTIAAWTEIPTFGALLFAMIISLTPPRLEPE